MNVLNRKCIAIISILLTIPTLISCDPPKKIDTNKDQVSNASIFKGKPGETLPTWISGTLEIHSISTGRGECFLYILPDGTSMMIDAAGSLVSKTVAEKEGSTLPPAPKPNAEITSGKAIAEYVKHFNPNGVDVDYWLSSHFDSDHMGMYPPSYANMCPLAAAIQKHPEGDFYLNGINEVGTILNFKKMIDRDYTIPFDKSNETRIKDYIKFLNWTKQKKGTQHETIHVGKTDQLVLTHKPAEYNNFKIRIVSGSGYFWTGNADEIFCNLPTGADGKPDPVAVKNMNPTENIFSVAILLDWGRFNLFSGGDIQAEGKNSCNWFDAESPIASFATPVEVMKANHHGQNANTPGLISKLRPQTVMLTPWRISQPRLMNITDITKNSPGVNIFSTSLAPSNDTYSDAVAKRFLAKEGHIVIKVAPSGHYKVFVLDDNNMEYRILAIHGPYTSN